MQSKHVLPVMSETFMLLVKTLREHQDSADIFELWLDRMKVKGDLAVIQKFFKKPMLAKSENLDRIKRAVKANLQYVDIPDHLVVDQEFHTMVKNKETQVIRSFHDFDRTPSYEELLQILHKMDEQKPHFLKIATHVNQDGDAKNLLDLLEEPRYKGRLIITGMGDLARSVRIHAPLKGSVFFYAPIDARQASAPGQLILEDLQREWELL